MPDGYYLTPAQYEDFRKLVLWFKARTGGLPAEIGRNVQHVKVTGAETSAAGYFPGIVVAWDTAADAEKEYGECWVYSIDGSSLETDAHVHAIQTGNKSIDSEMRPTFETTSVSGSSTITVVTCVQDLP